MLVVEVANAAGRQAFVMEGAAQAVQDAMVDMGARLVTEVDPVFVTLADPPVISSPSNKRVRERAHRLRRVEAPRAGPPRDCTLQRPPG